MRAWLTVLCGFAGIGTALAASGMPTTRSFLTTVGIGLFVSVGGAILLEVRHKK
jgi:hypothetical protein